MSAATDSPTRIRQLPPLVVNQIAAGEVVDRPASVVKELIDNALDAKARRITVELEQGGIELVRITDDGTGIGVDDLPMAIAPHATSKIRSAEDLDHIATMGFRGEALASIASVSRLSLRSRTAADAGAHQIDIEGDTAGPVKPAAGPVGTSVSVRNLFFNTPARRKFLRTPSTEQGHCVDMALDLAMSHPAIGFSVLCDGRRALEVPPDQSPRERVLALLGNELADEMLEVHADRFDDARGVALWGLVGLPSIARATAKSQHVYLNGRPIRDKTIQHALREAYRGLIEPGRYPTAVLMIEMDPRSVDVNVHPAKSEVRFRDQSMVHSLVLRTVKDALRAADLTPAVHAFGRHGNGAPSAPGAGSFLPGPGAASPAGFDAANSARAFADFFKRQAPTAAETRGERLNYGVVREALAPINTEIEGKPGVPSDPSGDGGLPQPPDEILPVSDAGETPLVAKTPLRDDPASGGVAAVAQGETVSELSPTPRPASRLLQVHNSYIVTQDESGLLIVDQHALHERAMFEYLLLRLGEGALESQRLLMPAVVRLEPRQVTRVDDLAPLLKRLGISVEPISATDVGVHAFPSFLFERGVDPGEFLHDLLERADADGFAPASEAAVHEVLDMMACKAAIKAGDRLSDLEIADLLKLREHVERSSNCPHGRPTSIRLTIQELEKRFGRS